jgi:hypothetical protein
MVKNSRHLTRPTLSVISPTHPEAVPPRRHTHIHEGHRVGVVLLLSMLDQTEPLAPLRRELKLVALLRRETYFSP